MKMRLKMYLRPFCSGPYVLTYLSVGIWNDAECVFWMTGTHHSGNNDVLVSV